MPARSTEENGFTFVELLTVVAVLGVFLYLSGGLFVSLFVDLPKAGRAIQTHAAIGTLLERVQRDVDQARALPDQAGTLSSGPAALLIGQADALAAYTVEPDRVRRTLFSADGTQAKESSTWDLSGGVIEWKVLKQAGRAYAVEAATAAVIRSGGRENRTLASARLFFLPADGKGARP